MPVKISCIGNTDCKVSTPSGVKSKHTTRVKAERQKRLINAVEHGWKPTNKVGKVSPTGL